MRFNKQELLTLASQPSHKFDREGILILKEKQDGFFRKTECSKTEHNKESKRDKLKNLSCVGAAVNLERWCRLRGNLLFYLRAAEQWAEPLGVIVLEHCSVRTSPENHSGHWPFLIVWDGGVSQQMAALTEADRTGWLQAIQLATYECMRSQLLALQDRLEKKRGTDPDIDINMWRLQKGITLDINEVPLCEVSLSCDNLLCDAHGRPPCPLLVVHISSPNHHWIKYFTTEVVEKSSNPIFMNSVSFRNSDCLDSNTSVRFTAYDMRERVSNTAVPMGSTTVMLNTIRDTQRLRIPLTNRECNTIGFLTLNGWSLEQSNSTSSPLHSASTTTNNALYIDANGNKQPTHRIMSHRRSQSLPPRLGVKLAIASHGSMMSRMCVNPHQVVYRLHSGLGGDITVHEVMAESKLSFSLPQQLLSVWIHREKELLQEVLCMGELDSDGEYTHAQTHLLNTHLNLLYYYSHARQNLHNHSASPISFKQSSRKADPYLEFAPVNLHIQRMWVHNDTINKSGFYDLISVGAFTAHCQKFGAPGGLFKLVQQMKSKNCDALDTRVQMAGDAVQAIKQLRGEVVQAMRGLLSLAKARQSVGMMPLADQMVSKTRTLLSLWDPGLVEEALAFIDTHKMVHKPEESGNKGARPQVLSPFKRLTEQLSLLDLKSPEIEDFATPSTPQSQWPITGRENPMAISNANNNKETPSSDNVNSNQTTELTFHSNYFNQMSDERPHINEMKSLNVCVNETNNMAEVTTTTNDAENPLTADTDITQSTADDAYNGDLNKQFLDIQAMSNSPSANYYQPNDEPEPWDLTQLNVEASVMCLVSKVKFLCGRCGSPAVRLRGNRRIEKGIVTNQPSVVNNKNSGVDDIVHIPLKEDENKADPSWVASEALNKTVDTVNRVASRGNKFTDGLVLDTLQDWAAELRPSMRKLRQAMDGLLKGGRLAHAVLRTRQSRKTIQHLAALQIRRDVCFSQALTSLVTGLVCWLWNTSVETVVGMLRGELGPVCCCQGLLSLYGSETTMWNDMIIAVEDLSTVQFTLVPYTNNALPHVTGTRFSLHVSIPAPTQIYTQLPSKQTTFTVTPTFFNIGVNEKATLAETLGSTAPQYRSNCDNFERLNEYYLRYKKLNLPTDSSTPRVSSSVRPLSDIVECLRQAVYSKVPKNIDVLQLASHAVRLMHGIRTISCMSAKDRTGMACTLDQVQILASDYHLAEHEFFRALDCMRSEGCRRENTYKNTGVRKYAFNKLQLMALPKLYRPPVGTYGATQT